MNMSALQSLVTGFVSGFAEMLPISADAHRLILRTIFGASSEDAIFRFFCHLSCFLALIWMLQSDLRHLKRTRQMMNGASYRRSQKIDLASSFTVRLLHVAIWSMLILRVLLWKTDFIRNHAGYMALTLTVNGILLLIPALVRSGDMDSRNMPKITGAMMGAAGGLAGIPGISPVGAVSSVGMALGVDRQFALRFAYILTIPGLGISCVLDLVTMVTGQLSGFSGRGLAFSLMGAVMAAVSSVLGVRLMRWLSEKRAFDCFAYYCWCAALVSFILFLIV